MDDLIGREAAIEAISYHEDIDNEAYKIVKRILTLQEAIPAVSLDKLCEWLADYMFSNDCAKDDMMETPDFWREEITKWMEEQDAVDKR